MTDKELLLKKAARRRLVGAVTLVVLMLIVMPFVLKDRVAELAQQQVKITVINQAQAPTELLELPDAAMPADMQPAETPSGSEPKASPAETYSTSATPSVQVESAQPTEAPAQKHETGAEKQPVKPASASSKTATIAQSNITSQTNSAAKGAGVDSSSSGSTSTVSNKATTDSPNAQAPNAENSLRETSEKRSKTVPATPSEPHASTEPQHATSKSVDKPQAASSKDAALSFYVQYGVFSDQKNSSSLQQKLKSAGFETNSEATEGQGGKVRLRSALYATRAEALSVLKKAQAAGFSGLVAHKS